MNGSRTGTREASSPFVDFDRASWAELGRSTPLPLTADELTQVFGAIVRASRSAQRRQAAAETAAIGTAAAS